MRIARNDSVVFVSFVIMSVKKFCRSPDLPYLCKVKVAPARHGATREHGDCDNKTKAFENTNGTGRRF